LPYESWINNTNEGSTEAQTLINLDFFRWLRDEYGLVLDIYCVSAGAIDKKWWYGRMDSGEFKRQFPNGFNPIHEKARQIGTRLGTWGGPDGFGDTPEEEQARLDMMVSLCRDYNFRLFKLDSVVGQLRDEKQDAFIRMMTQCRKYCPDLILLNHRLNLNEEARKHVTTSLWEGRETYVDVHMVNTITAPHHRQSNLSRRIVSGLMRLTEDHGVCISSCLDYWEDDLVLHAFNRSLIVSPQIYGNPWFLRDDEYPKLARIYNIARQFKELLIDGIVLPEEKYGEKAVSRGNSTTRLITLRNISWDRKEAHVTIDNEIGLSEDIRYEARLLHPVERILGEFDRGQTFTIEIEPFRAALLLIRPENEADIGVVGCDFQLVQDVPDKPMRISLKGLPGSKHIIRLKSNDSHFSKAEIDGAPAGFLLKNEEAALSFPGTPLREHWHRKLADLHQCDVPEDAEALYEATIYSADNNALEIRSLQRSGETKIPEVKAARSAFLDQPVFIGRGVWDRNMFDDNPDTAFYVSRRWGRRPEIINDGSLRLDFGKSVNMDELIIEIGSEYALQPWKSEEAVRLQISNNLTEWEQGTVLARTTIKIPFDPKKPVRYVRFEGTPDKVVNVKGFLNGRPLDRKDWKGSNLFSTYRRMPAERAWTAFTVLNEIPQGAYLAICLNGEHGIEGAYAAIRVDGVPVGSPDRSPSYISNVWENTVRKRDSNYTYYVPLQSGMAGKKIDVVVLGMRGHQHKIIPEVWLTTYPTPYVEKELRLFRT
jgi:hypothetical protein